MPRSQGDGVALAAFQAVGIEQIEAMFNTEPDITHGMRLRRMSANSMPPVSPQYSNQNNCNFGFTAGVNGCLSTTQKRKYIRRIVPVTADSPASNTRSKKRMLQV
jgi:hypothetical protein